jgi:hypothetical protein
MAYTRTLLQLRTFLTQKGGFENSADLTSSVLDGFINDALEEAWDIIVQRWEDYYTKSATIAVTSGNDSVTLPTDYLKLRRLWILVSGSEYKRLLPGDLDTAHVFTSATLSGKQYRYRQDQSGLHLMPVPPQAETVKLWYIPQATQLVADGDTITFDVPMVARLVLAIAWRECLDRQELDPSPAMAKVDELTKKCKTSADGRDADQPFYLDPNSPRTDDSWDDGDWF